MTQRSPVPVEGAYVWDRAAVADPGQWSVTLTARQVGDVVDAVRDAARARLPLADVTPERYPLPALRDVVDRVFDDLVHGRGFVRLRGLEVFDISDHEAELTCWLLGVHVGIPIPQNAQGARLLHVRDQGLDFANPEVFGYQSRTRLDFHVDASDAVALLCRRTAKAGGASRIVSSASVHNALAERRPDLAAELYNTFAWDRRRPLGEAGQAGFFRSPVFSRHHGRLSTRYGRGYLESAQRHPDAPRLSPQQREALDLFDDLTNSPELFLDMAFQPGDMQLLNNYVVLHARTEYEDHEAADRKRDLIRLWLTLRDYHPLAAEFGSAGLTPRDAAFSPPTA